MKNINRNSKSRLLCQQNLYVLYVFIVKSFIELVKFVFSMEDIKGHHLGHLVFLSNNKCQEPLEGFFGCQRQCGGTFDNPLVQELFQNTQALRVVDSFCQGPIRRNRRGNASSKKTTECTPFPIILMLVRLHQHDNPETVSTTGKQEFFTKSFQLGIL